MICLINSDVWKQSFDNKKQTMKKRIVTVELWFLRRMLLLDSSSLICNIKKNRNVEKHNDIHTGQGFKSGCLLVE